VGKQARPIVTRAQIAPLGETLSPQILGPFLAVGIVRIPPQPGGEDFVLFGRRFAANHTLIDLGLSCLQPRQRRAGQLAGIPGMIGANLRVTNVG
jgi:hypothetical protein